jgi:hypothetical protein
MSLRFDDGRNSRSSERVAFYSIIHSRWGTFQSDLATSLYRCPGQLLLHGLSGWYESGHESAWTIGVAGQIKDIPELSDTIPYNPFKVDIFQLGRTILDVIMVSHGVIFTIFTHSVRVDLSWPSYFYSICRKNDVLESKRSPDSY